SELDIRSDIYALGVILYELLAGRLPYELRTKMIYEAARVIREEDPTPLSSINRNFRGDVETIVAKALEKDKARRYQCASALGSDIRRYLRDEPIEARPASAMYQLSKFARRNRALVGGVVAVFVVLLAGVIVSTGMFIRAERRRVEAESARKESETVTAFLGETLASADPSKSGKEVLLRDVLGDAARKLGSTFAQQPRIEAQLQGVVGRTYFSLGMMDEAEPHLSRALELRTQNLGEQHEDTIAAMNEFAWL